MANLTNIQIIDIEELIAEFTTIEDYEELGNIINDDEMPELSDEIRSLLDLEINNREVADIVASLEVI